MRTRGSVPSIRSLTSLFALALSLGSTACGDGDPATGEKPDPVIARRTTWAETAHEPFLTEHSDELLASGTEGNGMLTLARVFRTGRDTARWKKSACEIVAVNKETSQAFSVNSQSEYIEYFTIDAEGALTEPKVLQIAADVPKFDGINSISIAKNVLAVALELLDDSVPPVQTAGKIAFYDVAGDTPVYLATVTTGNLPDAITFSKDGSTLLVANEGEPPMMDSGEAFDYVNDPVGGIGIIHEPAGGWADVTDDDSVVLGFEDFDDGGSRADERPQEIHRIAPEDPANLKSSGIARWSQQFEPEYIAISPDGDEAWAILQEQNTFAVIDIVNDRIKELRYLGEKDGLLPGNEFDASSLDGVRLANWPVYLMYQPDTLRSFKAADGNVYYVGANEGDPRSEDWTWDEAEKIRGLELDPKYFPGLEDWTQNELLGSLHVTKTRGDSDGDGLYENLYAFGGRSFTIWAQDGSIVFDSQNQFEIISANKYGTNFNNNSSLYEPQYDSDWKGPEPEPLALGAVEVAGEERQFAFVGSEKMGGVWVYDITEPAHSEFVTYYNLRDFAFENPRDDTEADLATEGMEFISATDSPTGKPLLFLGNETSGTNSVYEVTVNE